MKTQLTFAATLSIALGLGACSSPEPVDETVQGTLTDDDPKVEQDNSPYDEYRFDAGEGWTITAEMTSSDFDAYLWLIGPDGTSLLQNDDDGEGTNARIQYTTTASGTYTIRANSFDGSGRGAYTLHYTARPSQ